MNYLTVPYIYYSRVPNIHPCVLIVFGKKCHPVRPFNEPVRLKKFHEPVHLIKISHFFLKYFPGYQQKLYINVKFLCPCFRLIFFKLYKSDCYLECACNRYTLCTYLDLCIYLFFEKCGPCALMMPTCILGTRE